MTATMLGTYLRQQLTRESDGYHHVMHHWHDPSGTGTLVLLHGAGVAAELTWEAMAPTLSGYRDVYCPDLRGMGRSHPLDYQETPFTATQVADDVAHWLLDHSVETYDLVGYSFGGLVALLLQQRGRRARRLVLIESALLERASITVLRELRAQYSEVADQLVTADEPSTAVTAFLDLVAPFRSRHPRVERMTVQRLAARPLGFAYALKAVNEAAWSLDREELIAAAPPTCCVLGGKSRPESHAFARQMAAISADWSVDVIAGVDHALPYQKPRQVAHAIQHWFGRARD
ncbi:MAG: alpha/beta fold hydrolase [Litorivicinaceae bacterium]